MSLRRLTIFQTDGHKPIVISDNNPKMSRKELKDIFQSFLESDEQVICLETEADMLILKSEKVAGFLVSEQITKRTNDEKRKIYEEELVITEDIKND